MNPLNTLEILVGTWDKDQNKQAVLSKQISDNALGILSTTRNLDLLDETETLINKVKLSLSQKGRLYAALRPSTEHLAIRRYIQSNTSFRDFFESTKLQLEDDLVEVPNANLKFLGEYFNKLFNSGMSESQKGLIQLKGIKKDEFDLAQKFYLGEVEIDVNDPDTWLAMKLFADRFQLTDLTDILPKSPPFGLVHNAITFAATNAMIELDLSASVNMVEDEHIAIIGRLPFLETLVIYSNRITDIRPLAGLRELSQLKLKGLPRLVSGLGILKDLKKLRELDFWACHITDEDLIVVAEVTWLKIFSLRRCKRVTDRGIEPIKGLKELRMVSLAWCMQITDAAAGFIGALKQVRVVDLKGCKGLTNIALNYLECLNELVIVDIALCDQITDDGIVRFRRLNPQAMLKTKAAAL